MSLKVFPEKISRLSKDHLHQCSWASSKPLRAQIEQKDEEEQIFSLPLSCNVHQLLPLDIKALNSLASDSETYSTLPLSHVGDL